MVIPILGSLEAELKKAVVEIPSTKGSRRANDPVVQRRISAPTSEEPHNPQLRLAQSLIIIKIDPSLPLVFHIQPSSIRTL